MFIQKQLFSKQKGAALIVSLVLLTMLTTMGVTAMRSNLLDVRIHSNTKSKLVALQCAEAALLAAERWIQTQATSLPTGLTTVPDQSLNQVWKVGAPLLAGMKNQDASWWSANGESFGTTMSNASAAIGCSQPPNYIVEIFGPNADFTANIKASLSMGDMSKGNGYKTYFRITAYGVGALATAPVVLQSTFAKPYN